MLGCNVYQDILSPRQIEKFTISKFLKEDDISVLCNKALAQKLIDSVKDIEFDEEIIELEKDVEYIVSKIDTRALVCELAKKDGEYASLESPVIVITNGEKLSVSEFDKFIAIDDMYILGSGANGMLVSKLGYYLEFGEVWDGKKNGKFRYEY